MDMPSSAGEQRNGKKLLKARIVTGVIALGLLVTGIVLDGYDYNQRISSAVCLACLGLNPVSDIEFQFDTANGKEHPSWILEPLRDGPVFIEFTQLKGCPSCDDMKPVIKDLQDEYDGLVEFIIIVVEDGDPRMDEGKPIYDVLGLPTFIVVTLFHDGSEVKPYFAKSGGIVAKGDLVESLDYALAEHLHHKYHYEG